MAYLLELADAAAGLGPELIAFIGGAGGAIFGVGLTVGAARKRLEAAEKNVAEASEACRAANENRTEIADLKRRMLAAEEAAEKWRRRTRETEVVIDQLRNGIKSLVLWMNAGEGVPGKVILDDISETLNLPRPRPREGSSGC